MSLWRYVWLLSLPSCVLTDTSADSETAKAMMASYHIGTLDKVAKVTLSQGDIVSGHTTAPRATFLQSRAWSTAPLHSKQIISWDTRIFTFKLQTETQTLGLPVGQHLMIRLRDPVTREAIIRSYTPISETSKSGFMDVLVKVYFDTAEAKGGKMTKALDSLPLGHGVDFKGPIGKFEYHGRGLCSINGTKRTVSRFAMISGGSGITPIFQVLRAVMQDKNDKTKCTVLNGNRLVEDILCKEDLDAMILGNEDRAKVLYTLTKAPEGWKGLRGRIGKELVREHCVRDERALVLVCGPEALEKSVHIVLKEQGWVDDQILFF